MRLYRFLLLLVFLTGCSSAPFLSTPTLTSTASPTPTITLTPTVTPTLAPTPVVCSEQPEVYSLSEGVVDERESAVLLVSSRLAGEYLGSAAALQELKTAVLNMVRAADAGGAHRLALPGFMAGEATNLARDGINAVFYDTPDYRPEAGRYKLEAWGFEASAGGGWAFVFRGSDGLVRLPLASGETALGAWQTWPNGAVDLWVLKAQRAFGEPLLVRFGGCTAFVQVGADGKPAAVWNPGGDMMDLNSLWETANGDVLPKIPPDADEETQYDFQTGEWQGLRVRFEKAELAQMSGEQILAAAPKWQGEGELVQADVYEGQYVRYFDEQDRPLKVYDMEAGEWRDGVSVYRYVDSETNQEASLTVFLTNDPSLGEINAKPYYVIPGKENNLAEAVLGYMALNWEIEREGINMTALIDGAGIYYKVREPLHTFDKRLEWYNEIFAEFMSKLANGTVGEEVLGDISLKGTPVALDAPDLTVSLVMGYDRRSSDDATSAGMPWITTSVDGQGRLAIKIFAKHHEQRWWSNNYLKPGYGAYGGLVGHSLRDLTTGEFSVLGNVYDLGGLPLVAMCEAPTTFEKWVNWSPDSWSSGEGPEEKLYVPRYGVGEPEAWTVCAVTNQ